MTHTAATLLMALGLALPAMAYDEPDDRSPVRGEDGPPPRRMQEERGRGPEFHRGEFRAHMREQRRDRMDRMDRQGAGPREGGPMGDRMRGERPFPPPPLLNALDANHDGVIDEREMDHASEALHKLDHNGDGKLTPMELRPRMGAPDREGPGGRELHMRREGPGRDGDRPEMSRGEGRRGDGDRGDRKREEGERREGSPRGHDNPDHDGRPGRGSNE